MVDWLAALPDASAFGLRIGEPHAGSCHESASRMGSCDELASRMREHAGSCVLLVSSPARR